MRKLPLHANLLFSLVALLAWTPAHAQSTAPDAESMEVKAFRQYLSVSSLAPTSQLLLANVPCEEQTCLQVGLGGVPRDMIVARLSGLIAGFGYGADIRQLYFASSPLDFGSVTLQISLAPGAPRLTSGAVATRAQRFHDLLKAVSGVSDPKARYGAVQDIPRGAQVFLMLSLRWERDGETGHIRLMAPPDSPKPVPPISKGGCPVWTLNKTASPSTGPFKDWPEFVLQWNFDCPNPSGNVE